MVGPELLEGGDEVNTVYSEGSGDMDKKYSTLYFSRCFGGKEAKKEEGPGCRIYMVKQVGNKWDVPVKIALFPDSLFAYTPPLAAMVSI